MPNKPPRQGWKDWHAPVELIDDLPSSKAPAYQGFIVELMLDVKEDGLDCGCRACQRIRRATRALEADMEGSDAL